MSDPNHLKNLVQVPLDQLNISDQLKLGLKGCAINTIDMVLASMTNFPSGMRSYLARFNVDYDQLKTEIYTILPEERIAELEANSNRLYALGALPSDKK